MAAAEGGRGAVAVSSGMMAIYLSLLAAGTPRGIADLEQALFDAH